MSSATDPRERVTDAPRRRRGLVGGALALAALLLALWASHASMQRRTDVFDDAFIYLHISQNAIESGTWRYYALSDREALLASSPVRIAVLTAANAVAWASGHHERSLATAKATLWWSAVLGFLAFAPWWRGHLRAYAALGAVYFWLATGLAGITGFESGLLLLWGASALRLLAGGERIGVGLACLLWLGPLIRLDLSLVVMPGLVLLAHERGLLREGWPLARRLAATGLALAAGWIALCLAFGVHPVPTTYLTKSVLPFLFEDATFASKLIERTAISLALDGGALARGVVVAGLGLMLLGLAGRPRPAATGASPAPRWRGLARIGVPLGIATLLFATMPANAWWYYENLALLLLGLAAGWLLAPGTGAPSRAACALGALALLGLFAPRAGEHGELPWSWDPTRDGRTPGYLALAARAIGDGRYDLPGVGPAILQGPEIGIIAYFSGAAAFQWDTGGLAQAPEHPGIAASPLRLAYPRRLLETGRGETLRLAWRGQTPVAAAWAIGAAEVEAARPRCAIVDADAQLCINPGEPLVRPSTTATASP